MGIWPTNEEIIKRAGEMGRESARKSMNLTESEITNLRGLELRAAVARDVFGYENVRIYARDVIHGKGEYYLVPAYELDHNAAATVIAEMKRKYGIEWVIQTSQELFSASILSDSLDYPIGAQHESLPVAVDHAALLFVAAQGETEWQILKLP